MTSIRQVLLRNWDPIGVLEESKAQDEYDTYIGGIYRLLYNSASAEEIASHLANIDKNSMGMPLQPIESLTPVALELKKICIGLERS